jgi:hypothetical protein
MSIDLLIIFKIIHQKVHHKSEQKKTQKVLLPLGFLNFVGTKRAVFTAFFLLSCYKIKICQKDTAENHLKIPVLLKSQN